VLGTATPPRAPARRTADTRPRGRGTQERAGQRGQNPRVDTRRVLETLEGMRRELGYDQRASAVVETPVGGQRRGHSPPVATLPSALADHVTDALGQDVVVRLAVRRDRCDG